MRDAGERHAAFSARLRDVVRVPDRILEAFERVPRHHFLPGVPLDTVYADDAVVTRDEGGVPTSSSSQPSLMVRMLEQLDVRPGDRVLEVGAGTGYNAALLAELGAAVTTVELQPEVAAAAAAHLRNAGIEVACATRSIDELTAARAGGVAPVSGGDGGGVAPASGGDGGGVAPASGGDGDGVAPGAVLVVTGDGGTPPGGPYDRVIVTAGCWSLPAPLVDAVSEGGVLVAPLRINGVELALALRREGAALRGAGGIPCGFMPLRGGDARPWRWPLGGGGFATADADLGVEGRGALDRLLATPGRPVADPLGLRDGEHALDALLWLGLQGDPLIALMHPTTKNRPAWTIALHVLPASLLVLELGSRFDRVGGAVLHGGDAALRTCRAEIGAWRAAGSPGPAALELTVERSGDRAGWSLPYRSPDGAATMTRGAHRWTLRYP